MRHKKERYWEGHQRMCEGVRAMEGAKHGFAVRTMKDDKVQMEYADQAETQAVNWFLRWFA